MTDHGALADAEAAARDALAAAESTGRDVLAGAEATARDALTSAEVARREVLAGAESTGRDALAVAEVTARDALAVAESAARDALASAESTGRDVLAAAALELTARVVELVDQVEGMESATQRFRRNIIRTAAAMGIVLMLTIAVVGISINHRLAAASAQQEVNRALAACPIYNLIIGSDSPSARATYPAGLKAYDKALTSVRRQSQRVGCQPP